MDVPPNDEARLRAIVSLVNETLPVLRKLIGLERDRVPSAVISRLEDQARLQERLLGLALFTLSNLPDDPEQRAGTLAGALRQCSDLAAKG